MNNVYDFEVEGSDGKPVSLSRYRGRVLLIVNIAGKCGFANQYAGLEALHKKYFSRGFDVLGFPCNQFLWQEPGNGQECRLSYGVTFPIFGKVRVNTMWSDEHPLYRYLKRRRRGVLWTTSVKWNFTKFLTDRHGMPVRRYGTLTPPEALEGEIASALDEEWPR